LYVRQSHLAAPLTTRSASNNYHTPNNIRNGEITSDTAGQWQPLSAFQSRTFPQQVILFWCMLKPARSMIFFFGFT
jgi:hypothetical protein